MKKVNITFLFVLLSFKSSNIGATRNPFEFLEISKNESKTLVARGTFNGKEKLAVYLQNGKVSIEKIS